MYWWVAPDSVFRNVNPDQGNEKSLWSYDTDHSGAGAKKPPDHASAIVRVVIALSLQPSSFAPLPDKIQGLRQPLNPCRPVGLLLAVVIWDSVGNATTNCLAPVLLPLFRKNRDRVIPDSVNRSYGRQQIRGYGNITYCIFLNWYSDPTRVIARDYTRVYYQDLTRVYDR